MIGGTKLSKLLAAQALLAPTGFASAQTRTSMQPELAPVTLGILSSSELDSAMGGLPYEIIPAEDLPSTTVDAIALTPGDLSAVAADPVLQAGLRAAHANGRVLLIVNGTFEQLGDAIGEPTFSVEFDNTVTLIGSMALTRNGVPQFGARQVPVGQLERTATTTELVSELNEWAKHAVAQLRAANPPLPTTTLENGAAVATTMYLPSLARYSAGPGWVNRGTYIVQLGKCPEGIYNGNIDILEEMTSNAGQTYWIIRSIQQTIAGGSLRECAPEVMRGYVNRVDSSFNFDARSGFLVDYEPTTVTDSSEVSISLGGSVGGGGSSGSAGLSWTFPVRDLSIYARGNLRDHVAGWQMVYGLYSPIFFGEYTAKPGASVTYPVGTYPMFFHTINIDWTLQSKQFSTTIEPRSTSAGFRIDTAKFIEAQP